MRRALIIGASIIVLFGAALAAYYYFFANTVSLSVAPSTSLPSATSTESQTSFVGEGDEGQTFTSGDDSVAPTTTQVTARLAKISAGPVVPGVVVVDVTETAMATSSTISKKGVTKIVVVPTTKVVDVNIKYIERQSGNIFSYLVRAGTLTRTSNRTLPGIAEAYWLPSGQTAYVRYLSGDTLSTINTYGLSADGSNGFF